MFAGIDIKEIVHGNFYIVSGQTNGRDWSIMAKANTYRKYKDGVGVVFVDHNENIIKGIQHVADGSHKR